MSFGEGAAASLRVLAASLTVPTASLKVLAASLMALGAAAPGCVSFFLVFAQVDIGGRSYRVPTPLLRLDVRQRVL